MEARRTHGAAGRDRDGHPPVPADAGPGPEAEVVSVLLAVPELAPRVLRLAEAADGDPGAAAVFGELADYVSDLLTEVGRHGDALHRCGAALEQVAGASPDAEELVAWTFLDALAPDERAALRPWLGPRTAALAEVVEGPDL